MDDQSNKQIPKLYTNIIILHNIYYVTFNSIHFNKVELFMFKQRIKLATNTQSRRLSFMFSGSLMNA